MSEPLAKHSGGCHCGAVRFQFFTSQQVTVLVCNCSICRRSSYQHLIVSKEKFTLLSGRDALHDYRFGTQTAVHQFCAKCGVKAFYSPRSHPGSYSVNLKCLDPGTITDTKIEPFDGANWERASENLNVDLGT